MEKGYALETIDKNIVEAAHIDWVELREVPW